MRRQTALVGLAMLFAVAMVQAQVIKLGTLAPPGSPWEQSLRRLSVEWSRLTSGRVSLKIYSGGVANVFSLTYEAGMAVALITTFYGALTANLIFLPFAGKLGIYSKAESTVMEMIEEGICAIAQGDNPTAVREKMQVFVQQQYNRYQYQTFDYY